MNLTDFLTSGTFPHEAILLIGGGKKLAITYRASDPARAKAAILAASGAELTVLGFDAEVMLTAVAGRTPSGDEGKAFKDALDNLDGEGAAHLQDTLRKADGAALADVLGSVEGITESGERVPMDSPVTAESCAALPADLTRAILQLVAGACLPAEKLDFLGRSRKA